MDTLLIIFAVAIPLCSIVTFFIARFTEAQKKGHRDGTLKTDIEYIKEKITDIWKEQERTSAVLINHFERIVILEQSAKSFQKRLDDLSKGEK